MAATYVNNQNCVWNMFPSTGNDSNGGGFVPGLGTNNSQFTDLVVDGANNKLVSSASYTFVAGDVNKYLLITNSGSWIGGLYLIVSVAAGKATLDMSPAPVSTAGGTYTLNNSCDYSRQGSAQYSGTHASTSAANSNVLVTSASDTYAPTATDIGNVVQVTGGTNVNTGFYYISAVTAGAAGTGTVTLSGSQNLTTAAGAASGITFKIGGAYKTIGAGSGFVMGSNSNRVAIKAETTINVTSNLSFKLQDIGGQGGKSTQPQAWLFGYTAALNDGGLVTFSTTTAGVTVLTFLIQDLMVTGFIINGNSTANVGGFNTGDANQYFYNCKGLNCAKYGFHLNSNLSTLEYFEATGASTTSAFAAFGVSINIPGYVRCGYIHDNAAAGVTLGNGSTTSLCVVEECLIVKSTGNSGHGFFPSGGWNALIEHNTVDQCDQDCINLNGGVVTFDYWTLTTIRGNILSRWGNAGGTHYGINLQAAGYAHFWNRDGNAYWNGNSSGANRNNADDQGTTNLINGYVPQPLLAAGAGAGAYANADVILTANPFNSSTDWSLNSTAGGGAACRGTAPLNAYYGTTMASNRSFGALQQTSSGGSTTTNVFLHPRKLMIVPATRPPRRPGVIIPAAAIPLPIPPRRRVYPAAYPVVRPRAAAIMAGANVLTVVRAPVKQSQRQIVVQRQRVAAVIAAPPVVVPLRSAVRCVSRTQIIRQRSAAALLPGPTTAVLIPVRSTPRTIVREICVRRNGAQSLFGGSVTTTTTVLVSSPRRVM